MKIITSHFQILSIITFQNSKLFKSFDISLNIFALIDIMSISILFCKFIILSKLYFVDMSK